MNKGREHIDLKRISDYIHGKMSPKEQQKLESEALEDPFLHEAIEGFKAHPEGLNRVKQLKKDQKSSSRSFFGSRTLAVLLVACIAYILTILIFPNDTKNKSKEIKEQEEIANNHEVDIIREAIDSLKPIESSEQIQIMEITENKKIIQSETEKEKEKKALIDSIKIDDQLIIPNDESIIPENIDKEKTIYAPSIYINDLYVVDYRKIKRENKNITYTRFELSGLSAKYENEEAKNSTDLVRKDVEIPYMEYLEGAMDRFSNGKHKKALNRYLTILEQYPKDLNAHFYGGHCYYNLGNYTKAEEFFSNTLKNERENQFVAFRQEAKWYLAKSYLKNNQRNEAKQLLEEIISEGLFYSKDAIQLLKELD